MKKFIFIALFVFIIGVSVNANDSKILQVEGSVININNDNKSFTVSDNQGNQYLFAITPTSLFHHKSQFLIDVDYTNIALGSWVKVDYYFGQKVHIVNEVNIY